MPLNQLEISSLSVQIIGIVQFTRAGILMVGSSQIMKQSISPLNVSLFKRSHCRIPSRSFLLISILGWFHFFAGGVELTPFSIAAVCLLSFIVPLQCILYLCHKVELTLFVFLASFEFAFALIISLSCWIRRKHRKNSAFKPNTGTTQRKSHWKQC